MECMIYIMSNYLNCSYGGYKAMSKRLYENIQLKESGQVGNDCC